MTADSAPTANTASATAMMATRTKRNDGSSEKKMGGRFLGKTGGSLGMMAKNGAAGATRLSVELAVSSAGGHADGGRGR